MSFSQAELLLKDPSRLFELLYSKYGNIDEDYEQLYINQLLYNKKSHYDTAFKEHQYNNSFEEFLRRFYKSSEASPRIPKLANYYKNYHLFFCKPIFREWNLNVIMNKYGDTKAEVFYKDNYGNDSKLKDDHEHNVESSLSSSESSETRRNNINVNKTIFDKITRKLIDHTNNAQAQMKGSKSNKKNHNHHKQQSDSLILNICDDSKLNQTLGLISRRSNNNSFFDLMQTLNVVKDQMAIKTSVPCSGSNSNRTYVNNHNIKSNNKNNIIVGSLCSLTKRIGNDISNVNNANNTNNNNKFIISPKIKMFLSNSSSKTKLSEFKQNNPMNNINIHHKIPNINMSSNSNGSIIPLHQKHKSYQQHSIGNHSNNINNIFQHNSSRLTRNNSKRLSYNLSLKKSSILSNPISSINSLSNNQNATNTRNAQMNIMKSPQHSAVNAYLNMIFNLNQNAKTQHVNNKTHTKTFFIQQQQSQRSSSYKEHNNRNGVHNRGSRNQRLFNQNSGKTINQSVKTFSQTKTLFTRSVNVNEKETQHIMLKRGNVNEIMNIYHKQHNNTKIQEMMKGNNYIKGRIMIKTINGFNVDSSNRLIIMNAKNKTNKNI